jgi:WD40 repeat protein/serine/threonine protein kinase
MGVVYKAQQREPVRRLVALKVIKLGMDTKDVVARFEAERQALALMSHPNVAKVFEAGMTEQGRPFFAMELVPGVPITRYCDDEKLTIRQRLDLFVQVCQAVQHAHQKGIIHRDLKPSNILVQLIDGKPVPKVIDFGVAKATNQALTQHTLYTQTGTLVGTPEYMSPEQAMTGGLDVDTRTDIYSLGVILYELLSGSLPFESKTLRTAGLEGMARFLKETEPPKLSTRLIAAGDREDLLQRIAKTRHCDLPTLRRELRGDLDWIVLKAMEKERSRRYETANGLAMDIQRHLNDEPVLARPPTTIYRLRKLVRRNKLAFVGATGFVLALSLGLATSTFLFIRESVARHRAVAAELEQTRLRQNETTLREQAQARELAARQQAYASDMNLVQQALAVNNLGRAQDLLNRQRPRPGQQDLRGWEWRYLWQFCRSDATFVLCQQPHEVWSLAVSQDGALAAVGQMHGGGLSIWDLRTRQLIARLPAGDGRVSAAFSPTGSLLAYAAGSGTASPKPQFSIFLWDAVTRQTVAQLPLDRTGDSLVFSADGHVLIVRTSLQIVVFEVPSGKKLRAFDAPADDFPGALRFAVAADASVAAHDAPGGVIRVIDLTSGKERWRAKASDLYITALAFSPDKKILASAAGYAGSSVQLWDIASGKPIRQLNGHRAWVSSLVFWPDGKTLASSSADQTIRLWDISKGFESPPSRVMRGHRLEVWRLALLPDNRTLISGSKDGSVYVWDTATTAHDRAHVTIPIQISDWRFAPDGESIIAVEQSGRVARWHGADLREAQPLLEIGLTPARAAISPDCRLIAAGLSAGGVKVWDLETGSLLRAIASSTRQVPIAFPGHAMLVHWPSDDTFHEWDLTTWNEVRTWRAAKGTAGGAASPDGRWYLSVGWVGTSALHDLVNGTDSDPGLGIGESQGAAFSPNGQLVAVGSALGFTKILEFPNWREVASLRGFLLGVHSVAFSPDGKRLAAASDTREAVKLWDIDSRQELVTLEGEGSLLHATGFSADGNALGSLSAQGQLQIWRAPSWAEIEAAEKTERK